MAKYLYPAKFEKEASGYSVLFPDLDVATSGETLEEAMDMAKDALCLTLYDMEESKKEIPAASDIQTLDCSEGAFLSLVECDTLEYRRFYSSKAVKRR